ncbi:MAG TPA: hypothetical protein VF062_23220 [Candidatus Limnocylindrales bacterium]
MGDTFEIVKWFSESGVIDARPTDCVLGAELGYPPGPVFTRATAGVDSELMSWGTNGLEVTVGRSVFHPIGGELGPVSCPHCSGVIDLEAWSAFSDALTSWHAGGPSEVRCVTCGAAVGFNDWNWPAEWPFAVGFLGFTFWNWPRLGQDFITEVGNRLGHRIVVTKGKL